MDKELVYDINALAEEINQWAINKGFYEFPRNNGEMIALMHSELSEALEGLRHNNPPDEHCPEFSNVEIELADCVIRVLDFCHYAGFNIGGAIRTKMAYNSTRPRKHGKEF